jgi:capsular exopolysaccharide synthesis family protein
LQFVDIDQDTKTFVITSPLPAEGKTRTAVNLALAIAQAGQRVVLVEADLRRPRVNRYLGLIDDVGVTTVLLGRVTVDEALQRFGELPLEVLASGRQPPNPSELLASDRMRLLIKELRDRADVVVIDAPPLLPVTDAAVLAREADGTMLVIRHGRTTFDQIDRAIESLRLAGARLVGSVVNMVPAKGRDSYAYAYAYAYTRVVSSAGRRGRTSESSRLPRGSRRRDRPSPSADERIDADADRISHHLQG